MTHQYQNADGTPASGTIQFTLNKAITNGNLTIVPAQVSAQLDATGHLSVTLISTQDGTSVPQDALWRVDERVLGAQARTYEIGVPSGGVAVELGSLMPFAVAPRFG